MLVTDGLKRYKQCDKCVFSTSNNDPRSDRSDLRNRVSDDIIEVWYGQWMAIVKLRQGSGKDRQGMALKAKGLKA